MTVSTVDDRGIEQSETVVQTVHLPLTALAPAISSNIAVETAAQGGRVWVVNQDDDTVSVFDGATRVRLQKITVGSAPRSIAVAPNGEVWVTNKLDASISVIDQTSYSIRRTLAMPRDSQPFGVAFAPTGGAAFVALAATGQLTRIDTSTYARTHTASVGQNPRHIAVSADGKLVYVSRFTTMPLFGESAWQAAFIPNGAWGGGEVVVLGADMLNIVRTIVLRGSDKPDFRNPGRGIPNYLGATVISPDGTQAWVPSRQDNFNFLNTARAISSRIDMSSLTEDFASRLVHDHSSLASAAAFDRHGVYLFVALQTSREVAVVDAHGRWEMFRFNVGGEPHGLALSADGNTLFVNTFMDRTVAAFDLTALLTRGEATVPALGVRYQN